MPEPPPLPEAPPEDTAWTDDPLSGPDLITGPAGVDEAQPASDPILPQDSAAAAGEAVAGPEQTDVNTADPADADAADLWKKVLDNLQDLGHMTLYLFSRPARPILCQGTLQLFFTAEETVHFQEVSQASAMKVLKESVRRLSGQDLVIKPVMAGQDAPSCPDAEDSWVERVRKTAQALGIPMKVEE